VISDEIEQERRRLEERERAGEAGKLVAQAIKLELEQGRADRAAEPHGQADEADATAVDLDEQVARLDEEILQLESRAKGFEAQLAGEVPDRRREIETRLSHATDAGVVDTALEAERDLAGLPALEQRFADQAREALERAAELNDEAAAIESHAAEWRALAVILRRHAETSPLAPAPAEPVQGLPSTDSPEREAEREEAGAVRGPVN
jgi:chromosome segregation ATPase